MGNIVKKILILGTFAIVMVTSILVFYPTIIAPPMDVPATNLHKISLENSMNKFSDIESSAFNDGIYNEIVDKLELYWEEEFLTNDEVDYQTKTLIQKYVPIFIQSSHKTFGASIWIESEHATILNQIANLRTLSIGGGKDLIKSYETDLCRIEQIINDYKEARKIANNSYSYFYSVEYANKKIQDAEKYRTMKPLSNCADLVEKLEFVKTKIGESHYKYVKANVNKMAYFKDMSESAYNSLKSTVDAKIQEYDYNRLKYGSGAMTTEVLKKKVDEYYKRANSYYNPGEINITSYDWKRTISPYDSYRAFESSYNHHKPNTAAIMFFDIKGYTTFKFFIGNNSESDHDYVNVYYKVKTNDRSYLDYFYDDAKGYQTNFLDKSTYKMVTLENLDVDIAYTVYVVYHKNGLIDKGSDSGYVLIPYE